MKYVILSKRQENYFTMFLVVKTFLQGIMPLLVLIPPLLAAFNALLEAINNISTNSRTRDSLRKGTVKTEADLRALMAGKIGKIAGLLFNFGFNTKNEQIMAVCREATESKLLNELRDTEAAEKAIEVLDIADANSEEILDYKITPERRTEARTYATEFQNIVGVTGSKFAKSIATTEKIKEYFSNAQTQLKLIDNFMSDFEEEHPDEWAAYFAARKVYHLGEGHEEEETTPQTENPVA